LISRKQILLLIGFAFLAVILFAMDLLVGSVDISLKSLLERILSGRDNSSISLIVFDFRIPKALSAIIIGAGLSVSGILMQSLFRNPLAGPYVLGVSSGASLAVAIYVLAGGMGLILVSSSPWILALFAILGSLSVLLLVLLISIRVRDSVSLLIIGIMLSGIASSLVSVLQYFSTPELLQHFIIWTFGSLSGINYSQLKLMIPLVLIGITAALFMQKSLNVLMLGDNYTKVLGVSIRRLRTEIIITTGIITGIITAFAGPIVFIGVAVPHLGRSIFKTNDHRILILATVFIGAALMLICDMVSNIPGLSTSLPINSVTSLIGAPVIIWIIIKNRRLRTANF